MTAWDKVVGPSVPLDDPRLRTGTPRKLVSQRELTVKCRYDRPVVRILSGTFCPRDLKAGRRVIVLKNGMPKLCKCHGKVKLRIR